MMANASILAFLSRGEEIILVIVVIIILLAKSFPGFGRGLRQGIREFQKAAGKPGFEAGRAVGGIYGDPVAEALTPGNQTVEIRDPAILRKRDQSVGGVNGLRVLYLFLVVAVGLLVVSSIWLLVQRHKT